MPFDTFTPPMLPSPGTGNKHRVSKLAPDFGVGASRPKLEGINPIRRVISLTWSTLLPAQAEAIVGFMEAHAPDVPFFYTPTDETDPVQWTCADWSDKRGKGGLREVTVDLEQSFDFA